MYYLVGDAIQGVIVEFLQPLLALESRAEYLFCLLALLYALSPSVVREFSVLVVVIVGIFVFSKISV